MRKIKKGEKTYGRGMLTDFLNYRIELCQHLCLS